MPKVKSQDLRAGMTVRNSLGIAVTLDHVEVFAARYIRAGWHMPACVLVFFGGKREHSHTFHFDEVLEHVEINKAAFVEPNASQDDKAQEG